MLKSIEDLRDCLGDFYDQTELRALFVRVDDAYVAIVGKILTDFDLSERYHLCMQFAHEFESLERYVAAAQDYLVRHFAEVAAHAAQKEVPAPPTLTAHCSDPTVSPEERWLRTLEHLQSLLHPEIQHELFVQLIFPQIRGIPLLSSLISRTLDEMRPDRRLPRTRLLVRDGSGERPAFWEKFEPAREALPPMEVFTPRLNGDSLAQDLRERADTLDARATERVASALQVAAIALHRGEIDDAKKRYSWVRRYATTRNDESLLAFAHEGLGLVAQREGDFVAARKEYLSSLQHASKVTLVPTMLNVTVQLAEIEKETGHGEIALPLWERALRMARMLQQPFAMGRIHEELGSWVLATDPVIAMEQWRMGLAVAKKAHDTERVVSILKRQEALFARVGQIFDAQACETERKRWERLGTHGEHKHVAHLSPGGEA